MKYQFEHSKGSDYLKKEIGIDFNFPLHLHQSFELIMIRSGEMTVTVDSKRYLLKENEAILIFPNQIHSLSSTKSEHTLFIFSPFIVQAYYSRISGHLPENGKFILSENVANMLNVLEEDSSLEIKKGTLYFVCGIFDKNADYVLKGDKYEATIYKLFLFIDNNYTHRCTLKDAQKEIGLNYAYLSRLFKKYTGISFNEYVNFMRLNRACYLMDNTDATIIECAYGSGYITMHTFERNFKEMYKMTPIEYRVKNLPI